MENSYIKGEVTEMAEKEEKIKETVEETPTSTRVSKEIVVAKKPTPKWVVWVIIAVVVVYLIVMALGLWFFHAIGDRNTNRMNGGAGTTQQINRPRFSNERSYNVQQSSSDGLTTTTTNTTYTQTQGVVTAVNSDTIVVAGGGKTQTIKTNSSTTYVDSTKPAVNDTVVIVGTKDGDTITATQIAVYN